MQLCTHASDEFLAMGKGHVEHSKEAAPWGSLRNAHDVMKHVTSE
jgi:hypothetical protein